MTNEVVFNRKYFSSAFAKASADKSALIPFSVLRSPFFLRPSPSVLRPSPYSDISFTTKNGLPFVCSNVRPTYKPTMPSVKRISPPMNQIDTIRLV